MVSMRALPHHGKRWEAQGLVSGTAITSLGPGGRTLCGGAGRAGALPAPQAGREG